MSDIDIPEGLSHYLAARQQQREDATGAAWERLTEREQRLVREAAVMGYVQGARGEPAANGMVIPPDTVIVRMVLDAVEAFRDLYPTLAALFREDV